MSNSVVTDIAKWMNPKSCANSGVVNCGFNTVKVMLEHLLGSELKDKDPDY